MNVDFSYNFAILPVFRLMIRIKNKLNNAPCIYQHQEHDIMSSFNEGDMIQLRELLTPPRVHLVEYSLSHDGSDNCSMKYTSIYMKYTSILNFSIIIFVISRK